KSAVVMKVVADHHIFCSISNHESGAGCIVNRVVSKKVPRRNGSRGHDGASKPDRIDAIDDIALDNVVRSVDHPNPKHSGVAETVVLDCIEISVFHTNVRSNSESGLR